MPATPNSRAWKELSSKRIRRHWDAEIDESFIQLSPEIGSLTLARGIGWPNCESKGTDVITQQVRNFYISHSATSNPGSLSSMLDALPIDIGELIDVIGGLLMHPHTAGDLFGEPEPADRGAGALTMTEMLAQLRAIDSAPLIKSRHPANRLRVNCGRFAMFFVAVLRHHKVPARKRAGFDWDGWIHEIVEYWDGHSGRWLLIDPDVATREPIRNFLARTHRSDPVDSDLDLVRPGEAFTPGALAWRLCRAGRASGDQFRLPDHDGVSGVRVALLQDLDSVNKVELRTFDEWHPLITAPMEQLDDGDLTWLDNAAALIDDSTNTLDELRAFYDASPYGIAVRTRLNQILAAARAQPAGRNQELWGG